MTPIHARLGQANKLALVYIIKMAKIDVQITYSPRSAAKSTVGAGDHMEIMGRFNIMKFTRLHLR